MWEIPKFMNEKKTNPQGAELVLTYCIKLFRYVKANVKEIISLFLGALLVVAFLLFLFVCYVFVM